MTRIAAPPKSPIRLTIQHSSLLVFASPAQKAADAKKVFTLKPDIITGTEAGVASGNLDDALRREAKAAGYFIWMPGVQDSWVAIREKHILDVLDKGNVPVLKSAKGAGDPNGPYGAKGIPWVTVMTPFGKLTVGAGHWLTKGRTPDQTPPGELNHFTLNTKMAEAVGAWAKEKGRGKGILFYGADTNIVDARADVFRGAPLTTCWDDMKRWPNTGHGNIDVIARYDRDKRVKCTSAKVLTDKEFHMHSDHFTVQARYRIDL